MYESEESETEDIPKKHSRRYEWDKLFKKKGEVTLIKDKDYNGQDANMMIQLRAAAKKKGYKVSVHVGEGYIRFTVLGKIKTNSNGRKK